MKYVIRSIESLLRRQVQAETTTTAPAAAGEDLLTVACTRRWSPGDKGWLGTADDGEIITVAEAIDSATLQLAEPLVSSRPDGAELQRHPRVEILRYNPPALSRFPAITLQPDGRDEEWIATGLTSQTFAVTIGIWVEAAGGQESSDLLLDLTRRVETTLWRSGPALPMEPRIHTVLTEPFTSGDLVMRVENGDGFLGETWIESCERAEAVNVCANLGGGVLELAVSPDFSFPVGASVWKPCRACNWSEFSTTFGLSQSSGTPLSYARIDLTLMVSQLHTPFKIDGVTQ